jgi:hypothetical protein
VIFEKSKMKDNMLSLLPGSHDTARSDEKRFCRYTLIGHCPALRLRAMSVLLAVSGLAIAWCLPAQAQTADFGTVSVGCTSGTIAVPVTFDSAGTLRSWAVYTQGVTGLDFSEVPAGTTFSTATNYGAGDICSVALEFAPRYAGLCAGFVNGDTNSVVSGTATLATLATQRSQPGNYPITFSGEGLSAANYSIVYSNAMLTIEQ